MSDLSVMLHEAGYGRPAFIFYMDGETFFRVGKIKNDYIVVSGSVQGPAKRQLLLTSPIRPHRTHERRSYEFIELR